MPSLDVFKSDAFSMMSLTEAINKLPAVPGKIGSLGLFQNRGITTTAAFIEERHGKLELISTAARGTMPNVQSGRTRQGRSFAVPHIPVNSVILADDVQGIRQFGSETAMETVASMVNDRLAEMRQNLDVTAEYQMAGAIQGKVLDADGTTTIYNWFTEFGQSEDTENFDTATAGDMKASTIAVKRLIEDALGATPFTGIRCLASETWFDAFTDDDDVSGAYARWREGEFLRTDNRAGFRIWGVTFEEYRANLGATKFIPEGEARFFPEGVPGLFLRVNAPAPFMETVNTVGRPFYSKQERMPFDVGVQLHANMNPLFICTRPKCLVKGTFS